MRMFLTMTALAGVLLLAGCDNSDSAKNSDKASMSVSNDGQDFTISSPDGKNQINVSASGKAPDSMPDFMPLYPGAKVLATMDMAQSTAAQGGALNFTTSDSPGDVVAYYKQKAKAAGMEPKLANTSDANATFMAANEEKETSMQVIAIKDGAQTGVQLIWNDPK